MREIVMIVVLASSACGAAVPQVQGKGGPAWTELTSEHFTVWTDAKVADARERVRVMERLRQVIVSVAFRSVPATGRTLVVLLRDDDELAALSGTQEPRPYTLPAQAPLWQATMVLSASSDDNDDNSNEAHELTHAISSGVVHHQPRW